MKTIFKTILFFAITLTFINCNSDDDTNTPFDGCDESYVSTEMTQTFSTANGYTNLTLEKPLEVHHYAMRILQDGVICSIGYQNPTNYTGTYTIKITNNNNGFIYEDVLSFSQTELEYHTISQVLNVEAGDYISVWRTISPGYTDINQANGTIINKIDNSAFAFPISGVNVEFLSSNFEGGGPAEYDTAIPHIALGFNAD